MKVENDFRNMLLKRRELKFIVDSNSNPGFKQVVEIISKEFNVSEENIAAKGIKGSFGMNKFLVEAFIYDSKEDKDKIEPKPKVKKVEGGVQ